MQNINDIYLLVEYILNKDQFGHAFNNDEFNLAIKGVNQDLFKKKYGLPEDWRPGMPLSREYWQISQKITDDMRHLLKWLGGKTYPMLQVDSNGRADIPSDYIHQSSIRFNNNGKTVQVEVLFDNEVADRLENPNRTPDYENPACSFYSDYIQFYPKNLHYVDFVYLRTPAIPVRAVTIADDIETYDPANSVDPEWPKDMYMDIVRYILSIAGVNLDSQRVFQYAEAKKQQGV